MLSGCIRFIFGLPLSPPKLKTAASDDELCSNQALGHDRYSHVLAQVHNNWYNTWMKYEGDPVQFSPGLGEDIWHRLTVQWSMWRFLTYFIVVEALLILLFGVLLTIAKAFHCLADGGWAAKCDIDLGSKMLLAFTTVHISSDAVFGWQPQDPSPAIEVALLVLLGWLHWFLLTISSAVIVVRALRPLQTIVFAHDCVIDAPDGVLQVRVMNRHTQQFVIRPTVTMLALVGMEFANLPLNKGSIDGYANMGGGITTMKHVIDESSPLHSSRGGIEKCSSIMIAIVGQDKNGLPVSAVCSYVNQNNQMIRSVKMAPSGRIVMNAKFKDAYTFREGSATCNVDNFCHIVPVESTTPSPPPSHPPPTTASAAPPPRMQELSQMKTNDEQTLDEAHLKPHQPITLQSEQRGVGGEGSDATGGKAPTVSEQLARIAEDQRLILSLLRQPQNHKQCL